MIYDVIFTCAVQKQFVAVERNFGFLSAADVIRLQRDVRILVAEGCRSVADNESLTPRRLVFAARTRYDYGYEFRGAFG